MSDVAPLILTVRGMDCADCARTVENGVSQLAGVRACQVNFATERLAVTGAVDRETVARRVRELGYDVDDASAAAAPRAAPDQGGFLHYLLRQRDTRLALLGGLLILPGALLGELGGLHHWAIDLCSLAALAVAGGPIARSAWQALRLSRTVNINMLMTIAAVGAVLIGAYTEAGMVMVLFAMGEALEGYTVGKARAAIHSLGELAPTTAARLRPVDGRAVAEVIPVSELAVGDVILVKPGERIPMDGRVRAGAAAVSQAPITGESRLVEKSANPGADNQVFAGSINGEGALEVEVTHLAADTVISRMIAQVEEAQEKRAPTQRFVDRFAAVYTPAVVLIAVLVAVIPPLVFGQPFLNPADGGFGWLYRGLALLVVACPCALVISTPVSIISAIGNAAHHAILIKGGAALETLGQVCAVAFDKTGTLTAGWPSAVAVRTLTCSQHGVGGPACAECDDLLALAGAVEERSEHPLAHAVVQEADRRGVLGRYAPAEEVRSLVGRGVTGRVDGKVVMAGSHGLFDADVAHPAAHCQAATQDMALGYTPLLVSVDGVYRGAIVVADTVRPTARAAVEELRRLGFQPVAMLTGDHREAASRVAVEVGIDTLHAGLLPGQKVAAVRELQRRHGPVAMVGDGINDTPALATADVGIAIGAAGSRAQAAMETADVTVMSDDLRRLPFLFRLGRSTLRTIHINVALSIGIKVVFVLLVLAGLGTMWMAVLADMGTSLLVTLYGMRLRLHPRLEI